MREKRSSVRVANIGAIHFGGDIFRRRALASTGSPIKGSRCAPPLLNPLNPRDIVEGRSSASLGGADELMKLGAVRQLELKRTS
jgi:hypothetical protein